MLDVYGQAGAYDKGKNHMRILARNVKDRMDYYDSLSESVLASSYSQEYRAGLQSVDRLRAYAIRANDTDFLAELQGMFGDIVGPMEIPEEAPEGAIQPSNEVIEGIDPNAAETSEN